MRRQQLCDIIDWCDDHSADDIEELCDALRDSFAIDGTPWPSREIFWISRPICVEIPDDNDRPLLGIKPWELAQYLGVYDYLYVSHVLSRPSLDDLLSSSSADDALIVFNPNLRAEQV
jgi:hypothetical protein